MQTVEDLSPDRAYFPFAVQFYMKPRGKIVLLKGFEKGNSESVECLRATRHKVVQVHSMFQQNVMLCLKCDPKHRKWFETCDHIKLPFHKHKNIFSLGTEFFTWLHRKTKQAELSANWKPTTQRLKFASWSCDILFVKFESVMAEQEWVRSQQHQEQIEGAQQPRKRPPPG